jgi:hypothetical protein
MQQLQQRALSVASDREATVTETLFRTRDALLLSQKTTNDLTQSIRRLTVWLIVLTIAITATTLVLAAALWKTLARRAFLPVGGIKDKVLAAHRAGLRTVILPRHNSRDVEDVPEDVWRELTFHFVDDAADVLRLALTPAAVAAERAA